MPTELQLIFDHLDGACCPEDVFGTDHVAAFKRLARACHPDLHPEPIAKQAFQRLTVLKEEADERVKNGLWGKRLPLAHCVPLEIGGIAVNRKPLVGDVADLYRASDGKHFVKVARSHDDNDLLRAEASALHTLEGIKTIVIDGVPKLRGTFQVEGRWKREANVISSFPGFYTSLEVSNRVDRLDGRTAVWMFKRILALLSWVHHFKLIHGAILPPHVMFYPDNDGFKVPDPRKHSIRLIDWCYSVDFTKRTRLSAWIPAWKDMYAPELIAKTYIGPESDICMAAKLIVYLCGSLYMPELGKVLVKCLDPDPKKRYQKANDVLEDWKEAAIKAYGAPKWHDFNLPKTQ